MTQTDAQALIVNQPVGFQDASGGKVVAAHVTQNGPSLETHDMSVVNNNIIIISVDGATTTANWEPVNYPNGIPQVHPASAIGTNPTW